MQTKQSRPKAAKQDTRAPHSTPIRRALVRLALWGWLPLRVGRWAGRVTR